MYLSVFREQVGTHAQLMIRTDEVAHGGVREAGI